ncbi:MAG: hypothetical protein ACM37Z_15040 [Deltaproteobacteria bacterium]
MVLTSRAYSRALRQKGFNVLAEVDVVGHQAVGVDSDRQLGAVVL